jgi:predicted transport protein
LAQLDQWNEGTIKARAEKLAGMAAIVWAAPVLPEDVLAAYRPKTAPAAGYTIAAHEPLADGRPMRAVWEAFRKEVLALDPCVSEEFLVKYVAYKAETNFVDVVPQSKQLRISLNMQFHEIHDSKRQCKDMTNIGHWGSGDVEVIMKSLDELPYVMGLVRQSFEKQMGSGIDA